MSTSFALDATHAHNVSCAVPANQKQNPPPKLFDSPQPEGTAATCPVVGDAFTISKDTLNSQNNGKWVYFCCPDYKDPFDKNPRHYLPAGTFE